MDGDIALLHDIVELKSKYEETYVLVDDCHSVGVIGDYGKGTASHYNVKVYIVNGTLGKSLGGASGNLLACIIRRNIVFLTLKVYKLFITCL